MRSRATTSTGSRTSSAISCSRWFATRRWPRSMGRFGFADVADAITRKMIRRHPHVFGDAPREAFLSSGAWERIKAEEKAEREGAAASSRLDGVPLALPALTRAVKLQKRAGEVGFDWPSLAPVLAKAEEEIAELKAAVAESEGDQQREKRVAEEFGDLLFVMANIARHLGVDPEAACAMPMRNSCDASAASRRRSPRTVERPKTRRSRRWIDSGTKPRRRREELEATPRPRGRRAGPARRARRSRFSGATRMRKAVMPSPRGFALDHLAILVDPIRERAFLRR